MEAMAKLGTIMVIEKGGRKKEKKRKEKKERKEGRKEERKDEVESEEAPTHQAQKRK